MDTETQAKEKNISLICKTQIDNLKKSIKASFYFGNSGKKTKYTR